MSSLSSFIEAAARALGVGDKVSLSELAKSLQAAMDVAEQGVDPFAVEKDETITIPVDSTCLAIVEYKPSAEELRLLFAQSGLWYRYDGVSPEAVEQLVDAPSVGREFNSSIRNDYPFTRES